MTNLTLHLNLHYGSQIIPVDPASTFEAGESRHAALAEKFEAFVEACQAYLGRRSGGFPLTGAAIVDVSVVGVGWSVTVENRRPQ